MAGEINNDVLLLPVSDKFERSAKIFEDIRFSKVYILYNDDPQGIDEDVNDKIIREVRKIVDTHTTPHDEVVEEGIDFYAFDEALLDIYRIVISEAEKDNNIYANLVGGTRPVALALTYACSLAGTGEPIYYASKKAEQAGKGVTTTGVLDQSFELFPIPAFEIQNVVPDNEIKTNILTTLAEMGGEQQVSDLLIHEEEIEKRSPSGVSDSKERSNKIKRYSGHANTLADSGLLEKDDRTYSLTRTGKIAANLIQIHKEVLADGSE